MKRRDFLRSVGAGMTAAALPGSLSFAQGNASDKRPNIIVILADDMGFSDIGCYGGEVATPNIDALAAGGLRFTQAYSAARCCPTRAALLTGLYPHQAGVGKMVSHDGGVEHGPYQGFLNDRCVTIAEALKPAGYSTYMSGKWHVGERPEHWPRERGFDRYFGLISGASSYWEIIENQKRERQMALESEPWKPTPGDFYMTDAFSDYAVERIDEHEGGNPFFMYLAYTAPHWPLHAWEKDIEKYAGYYKCGWDVLRQRRHERLIDLGIIDPQCELSPRDPDVPPWEEAENKEEWIRRMAVYAAMIDRMDQGIGRVIDALKRNGQYENTLILFMADNGGCHEDISGRKLDQPGTKPGERGSYVAYCRPWANASNTPFRLFKHWIHEGGTATPLVAHWPKGVDARGGLTDEVMHCIDIMPTCLRLAGAEYPETYEGRAITPVAGRDLTPVLRGGTRKGHEALYWEHYDNRGIRKGKWKLVAEKREAWELYDLEKDRTELHDLSEEMPEKVEELLDMWEAWAEKVGV
ncbi:MAG: sulfatase-like hydrolase/transferase [Candidatus Hydrogenedentota bacterium]